MQRKTKRTQAHSASGLVYTSKKYPEHILLGFIRLMFAFLPWAASPLPLRSLFSVSSHQELGRFIPSAQGIFQRETASFSLTTHAKQTVLQRGTQTGSYDKNRTGWSYSMAESMHNFLHRCFVYSDHLSQPVHVCKKPLKLQLCIQVLQILIKFLHAHAVRQGSIHLECTFNTNIHTFSVTHRILVNPKHSFQLKFRHIPLIEGFAFYS